MGQVSKTPSAYCRSCNYALAGLPDKHRCPECGREFDLADPASFRRKPPRGVWRILRWFVYPLLLLSLAAGGGIGWVWWEWKQEQPVIAWANAQRRGEVGTKPIGPPWLQTSAGHWDYLLERADTLSACSVRPLTPAQLPLSRLRHLTGLYLEGRGADDELMGEVGQLRELEELELWGTSVADDGLGRLSACRRLDKLYLYESPGVGEKGMGFLADHPELTRLNLAGTAADDRCVPVLKGLTQLDRLDLTGTKLTPAAVAELKKALPDCEILRP